MIKAPKGTRDILPGEVGEWQYVQRLFADTCRSFGFKEIRFPVFESTDLFQRGVGDTTDIVQKEMYTFEDKGGRSITLRPEGTAGVVRSYIENGMASLPQPVKLYYDITCYRYENVQKGRYREFHQFGLETFGAADCDIDAETISLVNMFFKKLGLKNISLNINSIGCPECRARYNEVLRDYFRPHLDDMCGDCKSRFEKNPLRIIDCKNECCKKFTENAPALLDYICDDCREHFEGLKQKLDAIGIEYKVDKSIVRGLDYYTKTVFEFVSENVGTQGTICGGGRYDGLVEEIGGNSTPGIGFAMGVERLLMEVRAQELNDFPEQRPELFIAAIGDKASDYATKLCYDLRFEGHSVEKDLLGRSVKAQMKYANKGNFAYTVVLGDDEIDNNKARIKNMDDGEETEVALDAIGAFLSGNDCDN